MGFKPRPSRAAVAIDVTIAVDDRSSACAIPLPFDPKEVFGRTRAPVRVTVGGHTFRSTTFRMGGNLFIPFNRQNREASGVGGGDRARVAIALDTEPRVIEPPADFRYALEANPTAAQVWNALSYTHRREHVEAIEEAVKAETRARRIARAIEMLAARS